MLKHVFDKRLSEIGLSRQDFCNITGLAYSSVSNWHDEKKPIPSWVEPFLMHYEKSKTADEIFALLDRLRATQG